MSRTAKRPIPAGRVTASEALAFRPDPGRVLGHDSGHCWSTGWRPALLAFTIFFYIIIYTMWLKAHDAAEHRHRRRRRGVAADDRLGLRDRLDIAGKHRPVPHDFPVDAAALLGAGAVQTGGLRRGRHSDDAECRRCRRSTKRQIFIYAAATALSVCCPTAIGISQVPWLWRAGRGAGPVFCLAGLRVCAWMPGRRSHDETGEIPVRVLARFICLPCSLMLLVDGTLVAQIGDGMTMVEHRRA